MLKKLCFSIPVLFILSAPATAQNCTGGLSPPITNGTLANAAPVWNNFLYLSGCAASAASPLLTGNVGINSGSAPLNSLTVFGNNPSAYGYTAAFNSNLGTANQIGDQINITNTASSWGLLEGFDGSGVSASGYHNANAAYLINEASGSLYLGANNVPNLAITSSGNIGIGTTTPSNLLSLGGSAARTIWMERGTSTGNNLTVQAGGGLLAGTNENGGNLILQSGISTGTGTSQIQLKTFPAGASGTTDNSATAAMTIASSGYVGIGTVTPGYPLDVAGFINTNQASGFNQGGYTVLYSNPTNFTLAVGASSAATWMTSLTSNNWYDVAVGPGALATSPGTNTAAIANTAEGYYALHANTSGYNNSALGFNALETNTSGYDNTAVGLKALQYDTTGYNNVAIGASSLQAETTGYDNSVLGENALGNATSGNSNVAIGNGAGFRNTIPSDSVFLGSGSGQGPSTYNNTGSTFVGFRSGFNVTDNGSTTPDYNVLIGFEAGLNITYGARNIILAEEDGTNDGITTGNNNILIGSNLSALSPTNNNQLDIGNIIFGTGLTGTGTTIAGNIGIGTAAPAYLLQVGSSSASGIVLELQNSSGACTHTPGSSSETVACSSDARLKRDIMDAAPALPALADMRVRDFTVRTTGEHRTGVIAQEMLNTHPNMVHKGQDGFYKVDEPNPWKLVKALQELKAANDAQVQEIAQLRRASSSLLAENAALKNVLAQFDRRLAAIEHSTSASASSRYRVAARTGPEFRPRQ